MNACTRFRESNGKPQNISIAIVSYIALLHLEHENECVRSQQNKITTQPILILILTIILGSCSSQTVRNKILKFHNKA